MTAGLVSHFNSLQYTQTYKQTSRQAKQNKKQTNIHCTTNRQTDKTGKDTNRKTESQTINEFPKVSKIKYASIFIQGRSVAWARLGYSSIICMRTTVELKFLTLITYSLEIHCCGKQKTETTIVPTDHIKQCEKLFS